MCWHKAHRQASEYLPLYEVKERNHREKMNEIKQNKKKKERKDKKNK